MHRTISNHNESSRKDGQANNIIPQSAIVKAESAENGCARNLDIEAVLVVD